MPVTINVNGLSLVHKMSNGLAIATLPDVCKTPSPGGPVPIPYPNIARSISLKKGTKTVKVDGGNMAAIKGSEFSLSNGDEPGTLGGVASGVNMKEATWITSSFDVKMDGKNACRLTDKMFMNHSNTVCLGGELQRWLVGAQNLTPDEWYLCLIFCAIRKKGYESKLKNPRKEFKYTSEATKMAKKFPKRPNAMFFEKKMMVAVKKKTKLANFLKNKTNRARKTASAISTRLLKKFGLQKGVATIKKKAGKKIATKFIPGLGQVSLIFDVIDGVTLAADVFNAAEDAYKLFNPDLNDVYDIQPDIHTIKPDGSIDELYDFKFDRPALTAEDGTKVRSYKDKWGKGQRELFTKKNNGKKPITIDQKKCKCRKP